MVSSAGERERVAAAQRDPKAFGPLYDAYVQRIYAFVFRRVRGDVDVAQDLTATVFEKALRGLPRYQWRDVSFGAWLFQIARNEIAQHYRRRAATPLSESSEPATDLSLADDVDLVTGLARLSADDRELLRSRFFDDLPTPLLAEVLGITPNALYVRLHRALERLRRILAEGEVSHAD